MTHEEIIVQLSHLIAEQQKKISSIEATKRFYEIQYDELRVVNAELEAKLAEGKNKQTSTTRPQL